MRSLSLALTAWTVLARDRIAPSFPLSLDAKPEDRWGPVGLGIIAFHGGFNETYLPVLEWLDKEVPPAAWALIDPVMDILQQGYGVYDKELKGFFAAIAAAYPWAAASGLFTLPKLVMLQMSYEFGTMCTSITANQVNNTIIHGRNLDYSMPVKNLTAKVVFTQQGSVTYVGTTFVGYLGLLTGMRPGGWSVSQDTRSENASTFEIFLEDFIAAGQDARLAGFNIRDALSQERTFEGAIAHLAGTRTTMRQYLAIAGVSGNEGAIMTRNREGVDTSHGIGWGIWRINVTAGAWYRLVSNYDPWLPDPPSDPRRTVAEEVLNATGHAGLNESTLWEVLSTPPVLNAGTMYTTITSAATGAYDVWERNAN